MSWPRFSFAGVLVLVLMLAPSAGAATWHADTMAIPQTAQGQLLAVSCGAAGRCEGVGQVVDKVGNTRVLAEVRNGSTWSVQTIPSIDASYSTLNAVSCTSPSSCIAVGTYQGNTNGGSFAERWDGTSWTVEMMPSAPGRTDLLNGISCTASDACTAVGVGFDNQSGKQFPLVEVLNGFGWQLENTPTPTGASGAALMAVSCTSATACTAIGYSFVGLQAPQPYAQSRTAGGWAIESVPSPAGAQYTVPEAISCTAADRCQLVGTYLTRSSQGALAERWNGFTWVVEKVPTPTGYQYANLSAVSCTSGQFCSAVGGTATNTSSTTLTERWNGSGWSVQTTPPEPGGYLGAVSCASQRSCVATGTPGVTSSAALWRNSGLPRHGGPLRPGLLALGPRISSRGAAAAARLNSASSLQQRSFRRPAGVVRFGHGRAGLPSLTLAEFWNGSTWTVEATPPFSGAAFSQAFGTSCWAPGSCFATGIYGDNSQGKLLPLLEKRSGRGWSIEPVPYPAGVPLARLFDVSCSSANACVAVGEAFTPQLSELAFADVWNGTKWTLYKVPGPSGLGSALGSVSCPAANACTAVGAILDDSKGTLLTLAERWNGTAWTAQTTANQSGDTSSYLYGVSCATSATCMAVGGYNANTGTTAGALTERWSGATWRLAPITTSGVGNFDLPASVACTGPSACEAVGTYFTRTSGGPFADRWNGVRWVDQKVPSKLFDLLGVACANASACVATSDGPSAVWNGLSWTERPIASPPNGSFPSLNGVSCTQADCTAVGSVFAGQPEPLAERFF